MVLEVCRGVLGNESDAEDAFQATFLILARKAGSIRKTGSLASWLHGVAYRTALKARAQSAARQKHEARVPARQADDGDDLSWREVRQALHEEMSTLSDCYRAPLVLCYLEGATQEAAAVQLGVAKSTLRERLERGRTLLRTRLIRRGLGPAALLVAAAWPAAKASASVPISLMASTVKAASLFAAGQAAAGTISVKAAVLAEGVMNTMLLTKLKIATTVVFMIAAAVGGARLLVPTQAAEGADGPKQVQADKPQAPPGDKPRFKVTLIHENGFPALIVRDPSTGKYEMLHNAAGIPILKGHIEFHVKKLKEAKDDKSMRGALKGLEESVQNMKVLLSLPGVSAEKKPEDKKPGTEKPPSGEGKEPTPTDRTRRRRALDRLLARRQDACVGEPG